VPATVIVGAQWGDEGKGKIVDLLAQHSDLVCRYQGGPNAGHTIIADGETYKFKHMPSGILWGKECVLGAGLVVDPGVFVEELDDLEARGISTESVRLSGNAHLIMPWHVALDGASERRLGKLQIGTTRRGIGPAYADKSTRLGIRVQDLFDAKILRQKIEVALAEKNLWLERVYETEPFDLETVAGQYEGYAQRLRPYVADTSLYVDTALRDGKRASTNDVYLEGARARPNLEVRGDAHAAVRVNDALKLFRQAPSLGGVESLVSLPLHTSHRHMSAEERASAGIADTLVRLAVGIEDEADLWADLEHALAQT